MQDRRYDWDDAFANMAYVDGGEKLPAAWASEAAAYRESGVKIEADIAYGDHAREKFDIIYPGGEPVGLAVFIHGGYWMRLAKSDWTHLAEGARARGWAVCLPGYVLAPDARISQITAQIGKAIEKAATLIDGPIRIAGHSAGGHLVSRMVCADAPLSAPIRERVDHVLSISGLHDLRPLMATAINEVLQLDEAEAIAESAALQRPCQDANITCWVGGNERPEFIRQANLLSLIWQGLEAEACTIVDAHHNHFTVVDGLKEPNSAITRRFIGQ